MGYRLNYKDVAESSFEPIPEGRYLVKIEKVEETVTKKGNKPLIRVRYKIVGGDYSGRFLFDNITLHDAEDKGAGMTKHFLHTIEEPYEGDFEVEPANWVGKELTVGVIIDREYNSNKIKGHFEPEIPF